MFLLRHTASVCIQRTHYAREVQHQQTTYALGAGAFGCKLLMLIIQCYVTGIRAIGVQDGENTHGGMSMHANYTRLVLRHTHKHNHNTNNNTNNTHNTHRNTHTHTPT